MSTTLDRKKTITFNPPLGRFIAQRAQELGLSFQEFVRYLVVREYEKLEENVPMVDKETERHIGISLKEYKEGKYEVIEPGDEDALNRLCGLK